MLNKLLKLLFAFTVLFLLIGNSCETSEEDSDDVGENAEETENPSDECYDGLDDALAELDEIEDI